MSITLTIQVENGGLSTIDQDDLDGGPLTRNIEVSAVTDTENAGADIAADYTYQWFIIDKPTGSTASINTLVGFDQQKKVELDNINEWGTYRLFCIATHTASAEQSETNPLRAPESNFINIRVQSSNYSLEKPAAGQRNWFEQYRTLVGVVETGSAQTLANARNISLGGDLSGLASFNGSSDITIPATIQANSVENSMLQGPVSIDKGGTGATTAAAARTALGVDAAGTDNSTNVTLANTNYLTISGQEITGGTVPITSGGTGATTAAAARTALGVDAAGTDNSTDVTLANTNYLSIAGQEITGGTVPITSGGTGATTAAAARTALGVDAAGTDNSTNVTLAVVTDNYLSIDGQELTAGTIPISLGGTGATTAAAARAALGVDAAGTDNSTNVTLSNTNYLSISGQEITGGTVPITSGGTGATTAAAARTALGVDAAGTDNSTNVTLANTNYLSISGQEITGGTVPLSSGGTGATTAAAAILNLGITATAAELNLLDGITHILDEDNMVSDSATALATQQSIKAYVGSQVGGVSTSFTISDNQGTPNTDTFTSGETLTFAGSTGIETTVSNNTITIETNAVATATADTIALRDSDGNIYANLFEGDLNGAVTVDVYNDTGSQLNKGKAVYLTGSNNGDNPHVALANNNVSTNMPALGIVKENIADNSVGQVITSGATNFAGHGFATGKDLYIDTNGGLTITKPTGEGKLIQKIGKVINSNTILVQGAFRANAVSNLNDGNIFIGNASDQATTVSLQTTVEGYATEANTASKIVKRDANGDFSAGTITATLSGNASSASTADQWDQARTVTFAGGDVTGSFSIDGSTNVADVALTIGANSVALGTDTTGDYVESLVAGAGVTLSNNSGEGATPTIAVDGVLEDLDALGVATADGEFIVATGAGTFAYESGDIARTSLGLGTGDSPEFSSLTLDNQGSLILKELNANGTNSISLSVPASLNKTYTITLPPAIVDQGNNLDIDGKILIADANGALSWTTVNAEVSAVDTFKTISVSGQNNIVADSSTDTLNFTAGSGIDLTTNASTDTLTITASNIDNDDIADAAGIVDTKLATIATADKVSLSAINIDGADDIGAALADTDLIIVDDGAGGTNRKSAMSRVATFINDHASITTLSSLSSVGSSGSILTAAGNLTVSGNLIVNGDSTTVNTATLTVEDPLISLANGNNLADSVDIGFFGLYDPTGSQDLYAGLFRDADDGKFKLFKDLQEAPGTTINTSGTGYSGATLVASLEGDVTGDVTGTVSDISNHDTADLTEGTNLYYTDARSRSAISVTDAGGDGSLAYNNTTGVITYTGPSAAEVRAHFSGGTGLTITTGNIDLDDTAVTAGSYGSATAIPTFTVDQQGRLTAAGTAAISTSFTLAADSGSGDTFTTGNTLTFSGGSGIDTTVSDDQISIAIDSTVATTNGAQTLTNKTLSSPTISTIAAAANTSMHLSTQNDMYFNIDTNSTSSTRAFYWRHNSTTTNLMKLDESGILKIFDSGQLKIPADGLFINGTQVIATAAELNKLDGVTATTAELNILDGVTATTAELNILDGVTATAAELNILDGVTTTFTELNLLDGAVSDTIVNSKAVIYSAAGKIRGALTGNADTATALATARSISLGGNLGGSADFDGTGNITISATIQTSSVENAMLAGSIANSKLANSTVSFGGVQLSLGGSDATPAFDLSDATNLPTTALTGTITNAQLAGSIDLDKLDWTSATGEDFYDSDGSNIAISSGDIFYARDITPGGAGVTIREVTMGKLADRLAGTGITSNTGTLSVSLDNLIAAQSAELQTNDALKLDSDGVAFRSSTGSQYLSLVGSDTTPNNANISATNNLTIKSNSSGTISLDDSNDVTRFQFSLDSSPELTTTGSTTFDIGGSLTAKSSSTVALTAGFGRDTANNMVLNVSQQTKSAGSSIKLQGATYDASDNPTSTDYFTFHCKTSPTLETHEGDFTLETPGTVTLDSTSTNSFSIAKLGTKTFNFNSNNSNTIQKIETVSQNLQFNELGSDPAIQITINNKPTISIASLDASNSGIGGLTIDASGTATTSDINIRTSKDDPITSSSGKIYLENKLVVNTNSSSTTLRAEFHAHTTDSSHHRNGIFYKNSSANFAYAETVLEGSGSAGDICGPGLDSNTLYFWGVNASPATTSGNVRRFSISSTSENFTGQHNTTTSNQALIDQLTDHVGLIVSSSGNFKRWDCRPSIENWVEGIEAITIAESLPVVDLSIVRNDKKVFGVISNRPNEYVVDTETGEYEEDQDGQARRFGTIRQEQIRINSIGEGAIWVTNINGNLENGDYITSCEIPGYGMKQDDDLLHNYTVAKITQDCTFDLSSTSYRCEEIIYNGITYRKAFVGCTYHCG